MVKNKTTMRFLFYSCPSSDISDVAVSISGYQKFANKRLDHVPAYFYEMLDYFRPYKLLYDDDAYETGKYSQKDSYKPRCRSLQKHLRKTYNCVVDREKFFKFGSSAKGSGKLASCLLKVKIACRSVTYGFSTYVIDENCVISQKREILS